MAAEDLPKILRGAAPFKDRVIDEDAEVVKRLDATGFHLKHPLMKG
jgi:hypothetical protein